MTKEQKELYQLIRDSGLTDAHQSRLCRYVLSGFTSKPHHIDWLEPENWYEGLFFAVMKEIEQYTIKKKYYPDDISTEWATEEFRKAPSWFAYLCLPGYCSFTPILWRNLKRAVILYDKRKPHVPFKDYLEAMADRCWQLGR